MWSFFFTVFALLHLTCSKRVVITVGGNTTENPGGVFQPPTVTADEGDIVYFNFTNGNHTVTQSVFAAPCMRDHDFNQTLNGFNSGFRSAGDEQAITDLQVPIHDNTTTIWFFDWNTCAQGGVGAININESSWETYDGFVRNAMRLNGSEEDGSLTSSSSVSSASGTAPSPTASNDAATIVVGMASTVPLTFVALILLYV